MITIGTCGHCGGPVQAPEAWGGSTPPPQKCAQCGAKPVGEYGPVLPMEPRPKPKDVSAYDLGAISRSRS